MLRFVVVSLLLALPSLATAPEPKSPSSPSSPSSSKAAALKALMTTGTKVSSPEAEPTPPSEPTPPPTPTTTSSTLDAETRGELETHIHEQVVVAMSERERSRGKMSRVAVPAQERRVRVIDAALRTDDKGKQFVAFAIDARHGFFHGNVHATEDNWRKDVTTGCVYTDGAVFIASGSTDKPTLKPASSLSGLKKDVAKKAPGHACKDRKTQVASAR